TPSSTIFSSPQCDLPAVRPAAVLAAASCSAGAGHGGGAPTSPGGNGAGAMELNSTTLGPGDTYEHRFETAGAYDYYCIFHQAMTGRVVVDPSATDTLVNVSITSSAAPFPPASVKPGGRVVWTNNTVMGHTVTSI